MTTNWYNEDRVKVKGSAILAAWNAERQAIKALGANASESGLTPEQLYDRLVSGSSYSGQPVTVDTAMRVSTVYACVSLIAGAIATISAQIYERTTAGRKKAEGHEYWWLLNEQSNEDITASTMWTHLVSSILFYGDGFLEILRPSISSSKVKGFNLLHPQRVTPFRTTDKRLMYRITPSDGGAQYVLDSADVIHIPSLGFDGLRSVSPITWAAKQNIGIALAAEEYSAKFFEAGASSDIALKAPGKLNPEQADLLRASYLARASGRSNYHVPIVLSGGLEIEKLSINPEDAALISTRQFTVEEICRVFRVPPHMVGHTTSSTSWGTGLEQQSIGFVKYVLLPPITSIQQEFNRKLWPINPRYFVEFNTASLERGDTKTRFEAYRILVGRAGERPIMSVNDIRRLENQEPVDGGDDMTPVGKASDSKPSDTPPKE